jgi:type IV secretory pathway VirB10-like protein
MVSAALSFRHNAAEALAAHATFTWNKAGTRIRCNGETCADIMDVPGGADDAVVVFARHQADKLPNLPDPEPERETEAPVTRDAPEAVPTEESAPAPEPAGEPVETAEDQPAKTRRDTKALQSTIAELKKGDRVTAFFKHPRYGEFAVEGTVIQGGAGLERNQLTVGGWYLNINDRAAKHLQELVIVATAGNHEYAIPKPSEATEHVGIGA